MIEMCETDTTPEGWETTAPDLAMSAAREELALISAQLNDGHAHLITLMRRVLAEELWCGAGLRSPEHWLTAYAGLTWSCAHDIVRIAQRSADLPTMSALLDEGRLTLGQAAVIAKYTPTEYDADVAEFASLTTVTQLRRALCRYEFHTTESDPSSDETTDDTTDPASAVLSGDAAEDQEQVNAATDAAQDRAQENSTRPPPHHTWTCATPMAGSTCGMTRPPTSAPSSSRRCWKPKTPSSTSASSRPRARLAHRPAVGLTHPDTPPPPLAVTTPPMPLSRAVELRSARRSG